MRVCEHIDHRPATLEDLDLLVTMERDSFRDGDRFPRRTIRRILINPNRTFITDIILKDGTPIGYAVYLSRRDSRKLRLYSICIVVEEMNKGYVKEYLSRRLPCFQAFEQVVLEVMESNNRAVGLYGSLGFEVERRLPRYYTGGEDGLRMVRRHQ